MTKILTIIEENHSTAQMETGMPYLFGLAQQYAYTTSYSAITHPSLPNYLAITGGSTFGVTDDAFPASHVIGGASIFGQAVARGFTSGTYVESMSGRCALTGDVPKGYAVKHNPQAYYADERAHCDATDQATDTFQADVAAGRLPNIAFLIPNKCDDAHDCTLSSADTYLKAQLPGVLASADFRTGRLAVVVTGDENDGSSGDGVLTVVLQAGLAGSHRVVTTSLSHYSLSAMYSRLVGAAPLRSAATAPDMALAFGLSLG